MILTIAKDILHGLQYLHCHDLAHRDLKVYASTAKAIMFSFLLCTAVWGIVLLAIALVWLFSLMQYPSTQGQA